MAKNRKFIDNSVAPIIAFDFDDTINVNGRDKYPECGKVRKYAKEVINFLHWAGCKVIIWTSRDIGYNHDYNMVCDHITPMIEFLNENGIEYDAVNESIKFAPYHYNCKKAYAHLYVDDRGFGWHECDEIMLSVLKHVLANIIGIEEFLAIMICNDFKSGKDVVLKWYVKDCVNAWR